MSALKLYFFGTGQVQNATDKVASIRARKQLALLAFLLIEKGYPHSRDSLMALFWGGHNTNTARNNLRVTLSRLRKLAALADDDPPLILANQFDVQINPEATFWLDVAEFTQQLDQTKTHTHTRRGQCAECQPLLEAAISLYQSEFLAGLALDDCPEFEEWLFMQRERQHLLVLDACADLASSFESSGELDRALTFTQRQIELDPLRESAYRHQMRILALQGERSQALAAFDRCQAVLTEEFGVEPETETIALREQILSHGIGKQDAPEPKTASTPTINKDEEKDKPVSQTQPAIGHVIGREKEIETVATMLQNPDVGLMTVSGLGGVGKTMLAQAIAHQLQNHFRDGVHFVPLASIEADKMQLIGALTHLFDLQLGLGNDPEEPLLTHLASQEMLLVLDNFEHLTSEADLLRQIKERAPEVTILITSRERLNLSHEVIYPLGGLSIPPTDWFADQPVGEGDSTFSAVELFVRAARRLQPHFAVTPENAAAVARICQLVDGFPLGLELAAAWTRILGCAEIVAELESSFDLLASRASDWPERQRTIRGVLGYTWATLSAAEQHALMAITCFRGSFDRKAIQKVTQTSLLVLADLLDKSLVQRTESAPAKSGHAQSGRFAIHALVRQFAEEKLAQVVAAAQSEAAAQPILHLDGFDPAGLPPADVNELAGLAATHSSYYLGWLDEISDILNGPKNSELLPTLRLEDANIQRAYRYAIQTGPIAELQTHVEAIKPYFRVKGWYLEYSQLIGVAIERVQQHLDISDLGVSDLASRIENSSEPAFWETLSWLMVEGATTFNQLGRYQKTIALAQQAIAVANTIQMPEHLIEAHISWGGALSHMSDSAGAYQPLQKALEIARHEKMRPQEAKILGMLGLQHWRESELDKANVYFEQTLRMAQQLNDWQLEGIYLVTLGWLQERMGAFERAKSNHVDGYELCKKMSYPAGEARALQGLGLVATAQWDLHQAVQLHSEAIEMAKQLNDRQREAANSYFLGRALYLSGDEANARDRLDHTIDISREINDDFNVSLALSHLGFVETKWGSEIRAERYLNQALEIGMRLENVETMAFAHQGLGWLRLQQADPAAAETHFEQELQLKKQWEQLYAIIDSQTGLVRAALEQDRIDRAEELCEPLLAFLTSDTPHGTVRLFDSFSVCHQVLSYGRQTEADALLQQAQGFLQTAAAQFPAPQQQAFLHHQSFA